MEKPTKAELHKMLDQETQKQLQACGNELEEILNKYQCDLEVSITVTARGNIPNITVVPRVVKKPKLDGRNE